jgi:DNA polymerase-3 subunit epsilon
MDESYDTLSTQKSPPPFGEGGDAFVSLARRAEAFVAEQGGWASEDLLVSHVFGSSGSAALWRPLLRDVLSRHEALKLRSDGAWLLADAPTATGAGALDEFTVLDVETTGLQPSRQRIIEIAIVRFAGGVICNQWESLCNPERRVPVYITKLTGIDDDLLTNAPSFAAIANDVVELLDGAVIVGHNVAFDLNFLNEELKRLGLNPVVNERVDTLALASRLIPSLRKPTLSAVAEKLGLQAPPSGRHRAGPDAALTGAVAVALVRQAADAGYRSIEELKRIAGPVTRRPKEHMPRASSVVDRSMLATIPKAPGVYIMRDANDRVVYVGKAKNLRERVGTYFSQPLGYTRKMDGLIESLSRIQVEVVGSELEALLLESQLIRRYQPRYNTALRSHEQYPFIRVDVGNPWP